MAAPPSHELDTQGLWIAFPKEILADLPSRARPIHSIGDRSNENCSALMCSTDPDDIGTHVEGDDGSSYRAFLADSAAGGNGLTEQAYRNVGELLDRSLRILRDCPHCKTRPESRGCPRCVTTPWGSDDDVFRQGAIKLLELLRDSVSNGTP